MKALRSYVRSKLFRSIMRMVLLALIPTVALGGYACFQAQKSAQWNTEQTVQNQLAYAAQAIDKRLESLVHLYSILENDLELRAIDMDAAADAANSARMRNANTMLKQVISVNDFILEAFIFDGGSRVVASSGIFPSEYYLKDYCCLQDFSIEQWEALLGNCRMLTYLSPAALQIKQELRYSSHQVIPVAQSIYLDNGKALVVCFLSAQNMLEDVKKYIPFDTVRCTIIGPAGDIIAERVPQEGEYRCYTYVSAQNGWSYNVYIPLGEISGMTHPMVLQVLLTVLVILILGLLLAVTISRSLYQPINGIQSLLESEEQSSAVSLAQLEEQVARQLENSSTAQLQLNSLARSYAEEALLSQSLTEKKVALLQTIMTRHLGFHQGPYQCAAVRFARMSPDSEDVPRSIFSKFLPTCSIVYNEQTVLLVLETDTIHAQAVIEAAACELFRKLPGEISGVAIGCEIATCQDLYKSFNTSLTVLQHMDASQRDVLLFAENFDISNQYIYSHKDELALIEALQRNEEERLHHLLDRIFLVNYEKCVSYQQMQQLFEQLRNTAYRYAQQDHLPLPPHIYRRMPSLDAMREEVHQLYGSLLTSHANQPHSAHAALAEAADAYIEDHYGEDIYLDTIAAALHVSAKHLSKVYKQQRNMNLSDQIAFVRVEKAKDMLRSTDMTVTDIMSASGFVSRATFLRSFKKFTDISPSVYRQLNNAHASFEADDGEVDDVSSQKPCRH